MASYRKKSIKSKINRIKPKKSILKRLWFWVLILILILISTVLYFILFYPDIQIRNIIISGSQKVSAKDMEDFISKDINIKIFKIGGWEIDSKSIFLVNKNKINKDILDNFFVIEKVITTKNYPQSLSLAVTDKKPVGAFCNSNSGCFYIDQNGVIFEKLSAVPSGVLIVRQIDGSNQISAGETVVAQNIINAISKIQKNLKDNFQIDLKEAVINNSLRLNITTGENWKIYFDLTASSNIDSQIIKLDSLLNEEIYQTSRDNLYYIDLRPKDRAIVCDNMECGI